MSSTMALRWPIKRLKSVDLPTLGRPTMATTGLRGMGRARLRRGRQTADGGRPTFPAVRRLPSAVTGGCPLDRLDDFGDGPGDDDGGRSFLAELVEGHAVEEDLAGVVEGDARDEEELTPARVRGGGQQVAAGEQARDGDDRTEERVLGAGDASAQVGHGAHLDGDLLERRR